MYNQRLLEVLAQNCRYLANHTILLQIQLQSDMQLGQRIDYIFLIMIIKTYNIFDR